MTKILKVVRFLVTLAIILVLAFGMNKVLAEPPVPEDSVVLKKADVLGMFQLRIQAQAYITDLEHEIEARDREIEKLKIKLGCA
jgi:hypothetical protein